MSKYGKKTRRNTSFFAQKCLLVYSGYMNTLIKTDEEIQGMRIVGALAAELLSWIEPQVKAGMTTNEINTLVHDYTVRVHDAIPAPLNYHGFPKSVCTSVNNVVCHGIPNDVPLRDGDIINIDVTTKKNGFHGDTSIMVLVGDVAPEARRITEIARCAMVRGIREVMPGAHIGNIGAAIQSFVEKEGFSVVRDYCGHGIGRDFHEEPQILHYGTRGYGMKLVPGMIFTIEPMINAGSYQTQVLDDDWTVETVDGSLSAQWEHTILVTETGFEVLTLREGEKI